MEVVPVHDLGRREGHAWGLGATWVVGVEEEVGEHNTVGEVESSEVGSLGEMDVA